MHRGVPFWLKQWSWLNKSGLVLMTAPFQVVLGLIPKGVLAGLFVCPQSPLTFTPLPTPCDWRLLVVRRLTG